MEYTVSHRSVLGMAVAVISAGAIVGCGSSGSGPKVLAPAMTGTIVGRAMIHPAGSTTATPLANASVTAVKPGTQQVVAGPVQSDAQGDFQLDNVPAGPEEVVAKGTDANGVSQAGTVSVNVQEGQNGQVEVDTQQNDPSGGSNSGPNGGPDGGPNGNSTGGPNGGPGN